MDADYFGEKLPRFSQEGIKASVGVVPDKKTVLLKIFERFIDPNCFVTNIGLLEDYLLVSHYENFNQVKLKNSRAVSQNCWTTRRKTLPVSIP